MITLEINSTDIRLMEIEGGRVTKWASRSVEPGVFEEEVIADPQALGAVVRQLMNSSGISAREVIASVSGLYSISRVVMVPIPIGGRTTRQAVLEAVSDVMPLSEEELYISWQDMTAIEIEGGQQVLVVATPRDVIDSEVQALRSVGVNPKIMDLKAMALARAVNREQALIFNIEATTFDTVIVVDGVIEVMRATAWREAELSVEEQAEHLAVALELTVGFYNSHHPGFPLDPGTPMFITGQMSGDLALMEELQARVGYNVEPLTPPLKYPEHLPVSQYAVNLGLALKKAASSKKSLVTLSRKSSENPPEEEHALPNINLLPEIYLPWKPSARQVYAFLGVIAFMGLLFPLYQITTDAMAETATLEARYTIINTALERKKAEIRSREPLQKAINEYNSIVSWDGRFTDDLIVINSLADELGVEVQSIAHEGDSITVSCQTESYVTFREYLVALKESGRFSSIDRPSEQYSYVKGGTIKLKPGE